MHKVVDVVNRVKRLCEDTTRSSSQSRHDQAVGSRRSSATSRRSRSRDRRRSRDRVRSTADKSASVRPSRPYAAGLAAQLSQKRKQLEARAKEKSKWEKENLVKLSALESEDTRLEIHSNSPSVRETKRKFIIEIHDDDDQHMTDCQKAASLESSNSLEPVLEEKADDASSKGDDVSTSTTDNTPVSSSDATTVHSEDDKHDAMQTSDHQQTGVDCPATKSAPAVLSLMNLPMPPVDSDSDSEVTPVSTDV